MINTLFLEVREASCPAVKPSQDCPRHVIDQCSSDDDCQSSLKCCSNGCFKRCIKPVVEGKNNFQSSKIINEKGDIFIG